MTDKEKFSSGIFQVRRDFRSGGRSVIYQYWHPRERMKKKRLRYWIHTVRSTCFQLCSCVVELRTAAPISKETAGYLYKNKVLKGGKLNIEKQSWRSILLYKIWMRLLEKETWIRSRLPGLYYQGWSIWIRNPDLYVCTEIKVLYVQKVVTLFI